MRFYLFKILSGIISIDTNSNVKLFRIFFTLHRFIVLMKAVIIPNILPLILTTRAFLSLYIVNKSSLHISHVNNWQLFGIVLLYYSSEQPLLSHDIRLSSWVGSYHLFFVTLKYLKCQENVIHSLVLVLLCYDNI